MPRAFVFVSGVCRLNALFAVLFDGKGCSVAHHLRFAFSILRGHSLVQPWFNSARETAAK